MNSSSHAFSSKIYLKEDVVEREAVQRCIAKCKDLTQLSRKRTRDDHSVIRQESMKLQRTHEFNCPGCGEEYSGVSQYCSIVCLHRNG